MLVETPDKIVIIGELSGPEAEHLNALCRELVHAGHRAVRVDLTRVTDCQHAGLVGLLELTSGAAGIRVDVEGASWSQFMVLLSLAPTIDVEHLCAAVRGLVGTSPPYQARTVAPHHRPARSRRRARSWTNRTAARGTAGGPQTANPSTRTVGMCPNPPRAPGSGAIPPAPEPPSQRGVAHLFDGHRQHGRAPSPSMRTIRTWLELRRQGRGLSLWRSLAAGPELI